MSTLLQTYVRLMCERMRSRTFNMNEFKKMNDLSQIQDYTFETLEELGLGSTRAAYLLSSRFVLKVAQNKKGIGQNQAEFKVSTDADASSVVTRIIDRHPEFFWIVSELVRPLQSVEEFESLTHVDFTAFVLGLRQGQSKDPFINSVIVAAQKTGLKISDLERIEHWGKTAHGHVVLLDSGFTNDVHNSLYR